MWFKRLALICLFFTTLADAHARRMRVVTSFTVLADFVQNIGKDLVDVYSIVGTNGDPHSYEPVPSDIEKVCEADLVLINGLHLDSWIAKVVASAQSACEVFAVTEGISPRVVQEEHGSIWDPHAWHDPRNALVYIRNIKDKMCSIDPKNAHVYEENARKYMQKVEEMYAQISALMHQVPPKNRMVLTAHEGFGYFGIAFDIKFLAPMGMSTEEEARPRHMAHLISTVRGKGIKTLFVESISNEKVVQQIAHESNAVVGEVLYSDSLSDAWEPAPTYITMMLHNARHIFQSLMETAEKSVPQGVLDFLSSDKCNAGP